VFEDSPPGVEAGKKAGMTVIGILTSHSADELHQADYNADSFEQ
jgi:sugar-phosphatase